MLALYRWKPYEFLAFVAGAFTAVLVLHASLRYRWPRPRRPVIEPGGNAVAWDLGEAFEHRCPWPGRVQPGGEWECPYCRRRWTTSASGVRSSHDTGARVAIVTMAYRDGTTRTFRVPR